MFSGLKTNKVINTLTIPAPLPPRTTPHQHILVLPANQKGGDDVIVSDIHGEILALDLLFDEFMIEKERDRVFFAGDFFDRGENSFKILERILQAKAEGYEIYGVRGNHEDMICDAFNVLAKVDQEEVANFSKNCDTFSYPPTEPQRQKFTKSLIENIPYFDIGAQALREQERKITQEEKIAKHDLETIFDLYRNGGGWIFNVSAEDRLLIKTFIESLVYMIRVEEQFDIVHAMPLSEQTIKKAWKRGFFTKNEIMSMTWSRPDELGYMIACRERTKNSLPVYVGHSSLHVSLEKFNILIVDAGTYNTRGLFVARHGRNVIYLGPGFECGTSDSSTITNEKISKALMALNNIMQHVKALTIKTSAQPQTSHSNSSKKKSSNRNGRRYTTTEGKLTPAAKESAEELMENFVLPTEYTPRDFFSTLCSPEQNAAEEKERSYLTSVFEIFNLRKKSSSVISTNTANFIRELVTLTAKDQHTLIASRETHNKEDDAKPNMATSASVLISVETTSSLVCDQKFYAQRATSHSY